MRWNGRIEKSNFIVIHPSYQLLRSEPIVCRIDEIPWRSKSMLSTMKQLSCFDLNNNNAIEKEGKRERLVTGEYDA